MLMLNKYDELDQLPILMLCWMVYEMLYELMILLDDAYFNKWSVIVSVWLFVDCWVCNSCILI